MLCLQSSLAISLCSLSLFLPPVVVCCFLRDSLVVRHASVCPGVTTCPGCAAYAAVVRRRPSFCDASLLVELRLLLAPPFSLLLLKLRTKLFSLPLELGELALLFFQLLLLLSALFLRLGFDLRFQRSLHLCLLLLTCRNQFWRSVWACDDA